jgi:hypothetical protein
MLALARVELGAMLTGFTTHPNPVLSFAPATFASGSERRKVAPYGSLEYIEMLQDGLRTHYWAIVREQLIENYYKSGVPENHLLTYGRRATVAREFLRSVIRLNDSASPEVQFTREQIAELQSWDQTFQKLQRIVLYCLSQKVGQERSVVFERAHLGWDNVWFNAG